MPLVHDGCSLLEASCLNIASGRLTCESQRSRWTSAGQHDTGLYSEQALLAGKGSAHTLQAMPERTRSAPLQTHLERI